ncbi:hypothetical protein CKO28_03170 [Rhodovibrio sodomensis]|uniref:Uncharacterized protein n=1 Tax=Rhodovibrio sodomensis TaxID=1088 RepID=A0ABS1D9L8_9PROT|nr:hypothetical protein [Rhodovibrio sodomensis]MBK1667045.1 hypothetical protein [Rhodovibrio sodomensis]
MPELKSDICHSCGGAGWIPAHRLAAGVRECPCQIPPAPRREILTGIAIALAIPPLPFALAYLVHLLG